MTRRMLALALMFVALTLHAADDAEARARGGGSRGSRTYSRPAAPPAAPATPASPARQPGAAATSPTPPAASRGFLGPLAGGLAGFALGYLLCVALGSVEFKSPFMDTNRIPLAYSVWHYLIAMAVALTSSMAAGFMPARKAASVHPVDIIRGAT